MIAIFALWVPIGPAFAGCKLEKMADLPVTMVGMKPMLTAQINGSDAQFVADSGAFYSMLTPASAAEFKLKTHPAPYALRVVGIGGEAAIQVASVKVFTLAGLSIPLHDMEFLVGGGEAGGVGVLGQNVFRVGDVEYDLAKGVIRLVHEDGCDKVNLAYWVAGTSEPYSVMDIERTTPQSPYTTGTAVINGVKIRVVFDTGAGVSFISARAAERAGVKVDAPGVTYAGYSRGIGRENIKTWIARFESFKLGEEEIRNARLRIGESLPDFIDMLIGADFFLSHRLYVASGQHKLFFTYNGGPVFNLASSPSAASPGELAASTAADNHPTDASPDEPKDAAEFSRRGTAFTARRDFEHAIADLNRACELAPEEPNYFYERGIAEWENKQPGPAMTDLDQTIKLKPDHVPALLARAEVRLVNKDVPRATEDLNAADRAAAREADARLRMASAYMRAHLVASAVAQLDLWIAAHSEDARMSGALNERCWARGLLGQDLAKALEDCNSALRRTDKADVIRARVLNARGLVRLRLGDYDKSIADYDASLTLRPKDAWALYGRGVDKLRRGKTGEGKADMAAATALFAPIADAFQENGIHP